MWNTSFAVIDKVYYYNTFSAYCRPDLFIALRPFEIMEKFLIEGEDSATVENCFWRVYKLAIVPMRYKQIWNIQTNIPELEWVLRYTNLLINIHRA